MTGPGESGVSRRATDNGGCRILLSVWVETGEGARWTAGVKQRARQDTPVTNA